MGAENHSKPDAALFRVEFMPGRGHYVVDPMGQRCSIYESSGRAEDIRHKKQTAFDAAKKRKARACLCCGQSFQSEGSHNRMCDPCRRRASNDEATPYRIGSINGRKRA